MQSNRRRFLQTTSAALGLGNLPTFTALGSASADDAQPPLKGIRLGPDLDPIMRLIEETPRDRCVPVLLEQLQGGLPYRRLLAACFFTALRSRWGHAVYLVHSAHQASLDLRAEERFLPVFWAVDHYKWMQEGGTPAPMEPLQGAFPAADQAGGEFHDAMKRFDQDKAVRALVALARSEGPRRALELLWSYGCRDLSFIGHRAIAVASCGRALDTIGWQYAEPVLRFVVEDLYAYNGRQDRYYEPNATRADQILEKLPAGWAGGKPDRAATLELYALLRQGRSEAASEYVGRHLAAGLGAQPLWDAIHVAASELLILHAGGHGMTGRPVHVNTTANALHHAFAVSASARTRLLVLLQAAAWVADFVRVDVGGNTSAQEPVALEGAELPAQTEDAVTEIFEALPPRTYAYDHKTKQGPGDDLVHREQRVEPGRKVFALLSRQPGAAPLYMQTARSWLSVKANVDAHDYKMPIAFFEDYEWISPEWRPRYLAASAHWLHGKQSPDSPVTRQVREAFGKRGGG